jgi:PAS domain S-box-containing protein
MTRAFPQLVEVIECAPDGVVIVDDDGVLVYANARITDLFGFAPADLTGRPVEALIPERFHSQHAINRGAYSQHPRVRPMGDPRFLFLGRRIDGTEFPVEVHLAPVQSGPQRWTLAFIRDATERHAIFEELRRARQVAQEVARVKGEFLSLAAHDLSQPIQTLELVISALRRQTGLPSEFVELAALASTSLARMRELLKMLLDISRVESGTIQVVEQSVQVAEICNDLERQFGSIARAKTLRFRSTPCPRLIETDPMLLRELLSNLVANAIRYTSHGEVLIECTAAADGSVHLAIHDTGIGIPQEQLHAIFEDFYRGAEAKHAYRDGFGLGLGIVRRLSTLLGFPVTVNSEVGRGSTFAVQIPQNKVLAIPDNMIST